MSGEKEREREKGLKRRTDRASFCGKKRGVRSKVVVLEVEKKRVGYIYIYTAHVVVSSGAPGTNRMKAAAFVRHNPISLSREIFFKRRK